MFFTQEDYSKILEWILSNSIKDTEFVGANTPLEGNETIAFVQNGKNVNVLLKDLVNLIFLLGVSDFLNITEKYGESYISLEQAIQLIPYKSRKSGLVITFINENSKWVIYLFLGILNLWNTILLWNNIALQLEHLPTWNEVQDKPTFAEVATSGSYTDLDNKPTIPEAYTLPVASSLILGGIKVGKNLNITNGVLDAHDDYTLPKATKEVLGGVKVGDDLSITDGVLKVNKDTLLTKATSTNLGVVKVGNNMAIDNDGILTSTSFDSKGTTEQRPVLGATNNGYRYYDSTLGYTIVWDGTNWCNQDMTLISKVTII